MKIKFEGNMTLEQFGTQVAKVVKDFLENAEVEPEKVQLNNPIVQTAFDIEGMEEPVVMTTEHNEMLQVEVEVENGEIVDSKDNQDEPTKDTRLWSNEKVANMEVFETPTEKISSDYDTSELDFKKEYVINNSLKQKVYAIKGTDKELIRYFNTDLHILVAEEVVAPKEGEEK
jgi:hypothetical protein